MIIIPKPLYKMKPVQKKNKIYRFYQNYSMFNLTQSSPLNLESGHSEIKNISYQFNYLKSVNKKFFSKSAKIVI